MKRILLAFVTALFLALAPPVQAEKGIVHVQSVDYEGGARATGQLSMFYLADAYNEPTTLLSTVVPDSTPPSPSTPWIDLQADSAEVWSFSRTFLHGPDGSYSQPVEQPPAVTQKLSALDLQLVAHQPGFQVHLFSLRDPEPYSAPTDAGVVVPMNQPIMGEGAWGSTKQPSGQPIGSNPDDFALVERPGPLLDIQMSQPGFDLTVRGDLVLEIYRITLQGSATEGDQEFVSGLFQRPLDANLPAATSTAASYQERRFVRLFLHDATVEIATQAGNPKVHWAASTMASEHDGAVTLQGAVGTLAQENDDPIELRGGFHVLPAGSRLVLSPDGDSLAIDIQPEADQPQSTAVGLASRQSATLVGVGAILALAAAIGVGVLRTVTRTPALDDVERALEAGRFRRAAGLAKRVMRAMPGSEDALLARAIALAKGGRNQRAIREIRSHMAQRGTSDGSLHYVLGVACLDEGHEAEGRLALMEAARMTPSLAQDVAAKLGLPTDGVTSLHTGREANGYA